MSLFKKSAEALSEYVVGQKIEGVKLNQNESPFDIPGSVKEKIAERMIGAQWNRYPDGGCSELYEAVSAYASESAGRLTVSNSSNELIQTIIYSVCNTGDSILTCSPSFSVYERVASLMGIETLKVELKEDFSFDIDEIVNRLPEASLLILPSPANPAGSVLSTDDVREILDNCTVPVVIDEAYFEFAGTTVQPLLSEYKNLIVLRTFSKALGAAGLRLGYSIADSEVTKILRKAKLPFSVSTFQQIAGCELLSNTDFFRQKIDKLCRNREELKETLKSIDGIEVPDAYANFILVRYRDLSAEKLFKGLRDNGALVRFFPEEILRGYLRVTVGTTEENTLFLEALKKCISEQ